MAALIVVLMVAREIEQHAVHEAERLVPRRLDERLMKDRDIVDELGMAFGAEHILELGQYRLHPRHSGRLALRRREPADDGEIGRAHVLTPVTNAHLVCRLLLEKKKTK